MTDATKTTYNVNGPRPVLIDGKPRIVGEYTLSKMMTADKKAAFIDFSQTSEADGEPIDFGYLSKILQNQVDYVLKTEQEQEKER